MDTQSILISQYRASLEMLRAAIAQCPEHVWTDDSRRNRFWRIAYHTLHYAHLYLGRSLETFVPWEGARADYQYLGAKPYPPYEMPVIDEPCSREDLLDFARLVDVRVDASIRGLPLDDPSGFPWLPFGRLELTIYSIRHIQHHAGQLVDRLREHSGIHVAWTGMSHDGAQAPLERRDQEES
jgi:hypothetical protein